MSTTNNLIVYAEGIGPDRAALLSKELGIRTTWQLLEYYPFRYVDKTQFHTIAQLSSAPIEVQIKGEITRIEEVGPPRKKRLIATFTDGTWGSIELVWFKGASWIRRSLKLHTPLVAYGKVNSFKGKKSIPHPELSAPALSNELQSVLEPVYSTTDKLTKKGLNSRGLSKVIKSVLKRELDEISDPFTEEFAKQHLLISKKQALYWIHFPSSSEHLEAAAKTHKI